MPLSNNQRLTLVSFLTYFLLSSTLAPIGIVSAPMAAFFGQSITEVTQRFSWLTGGILVGAVIALFIFDWIALKKLLIGIYSLIAVALFSLAFTTNLTYGGLVLGVTGVGSGIGLAGGALIISRIYTEEKRASMLVITDGCFSVAGFTCGWFATMLVSRELHWSTTYQFLGLVSLAIVIVAALTTFPQTTQEPQETKGSPSIWPAGVWLCVIALFLYTLGQYSMLFWLPNYAETVLGADSVIAGGLVGQFWLGMFFAQVFVAWWVYRIGVRNLLLLASLTTFLFSLPLWNLDDVQYLTPLALVWGFANLAMLKAIISLATQLVVLPSARLVSLLLLGATTGTALSPVITSQIVEQTDNHTILIFGSACYGSLALILGIVRYLSRTTPAPVPAVSN